MTLAGGAGIKIAGGGIGVNAYERVNAFVAPILGGVAPGSYDAAGRFLHVRYRANVVWKARSGGNQTPPGGLPADYMPDILVFEFDAKPSFVVPYPGTIELIGGTGDWRFALAVQQCIPPELYEPEFRALRTFVTVGLAPIFTVPDNHTYLLGANPASTMTEVVSGTVIVPGTVLPGFSVVPGTQFTAAGNMWVITGSYF